MKFRDFMFSAGYGKFFLKVLNLYSVAYLIKVVWILLCFALW